MKNLTQRIKETTILLVENKVSFLQENRREDDDDSFLEAIKTGKGNIMISLNGQQIFLTKEHLKLISNL